MSVPAAKVRALCTASEASLVRSSRKAELARLDRAQVKKLANQARALRNKWREAGRRQSGAKKSSGKQADAATNSQLKEEIFREAQESFEARLAELEKAGSTAGGKAQPAMTKKRRSAEHRAKRAAVRKGMTAVEDLLNVSERPAKGGKPAKPQAAEAPIAAPGAVAKPSSDKKSGQGSRSARPKSRPPAKAKAKTISPTEAQPQLSKGKQRQAVVAAKQARIAASGATSHRGHISARGRRSQARRDAQ